MLPKCPSGKRSYMTLQIAEDALIELWSKNDYRSGGPVNAYKCDDCGSYHMTSQGNMNSRLSLYLSDKKSGIDKEANKWLDKLKHKR